MRCRLWAKVIAPTVRPAPVSDVVAAACVKPTTFGTVTGGRPLDTTMFMAVPTSTVRPVAGSWLITVPAGTVVLDCCVISDGGGAIILTSEERAKDLRQKPVYISGAASASITNQNQFAHHAPKTARASGRSRVAIT